MGKKLPTEKPRIGSFENVGFVLAGTNLGLRKPQDSFIENFFDRYWDRYVEEPMSGCWLWVASQTVGGYGNLTENGRSIYAHRASYECKNGRGSAEGLVVRHRCDMPSCINPDHLIAGTHAENYDDAKRRGRLNPSKGDNHLRSVLTSTDVAVIRERVRAGEFIADLAAEYGMRWSVIHLAAIGETWAHLQGAVPREMIKKKPASPPQTRGEDSPCAILTEDEVRQIRRRLNSGEVGRRLAEEFGVSPVTISAIKVGRIWSHVL